MIGTTRSSKTQRGTTLVMVLLFLILATVLGASAMSSSKMQTNMSVNVQQKSVAFERAENAREAAEQQVRTLIANGTTFPSGTIGYYDVSSAGATAPAVTTKAFWNNAANYVASGTGGGYVIEYLGTKSILLENRATSVSMQVFRLTVMGRGNDGSSEQVLQAIYMQN